MNGARAVVLLAVVGGVVMFARGARIEAQPAEVVGRVVFDAWEPMPGYPAPAVPEYPARAAPYIADIRAAEDRHGIPAGLLVRLLEVESNFNPDAINPASGARGIAQFMPATAAELGIDPMSPAEAIPAAAKYLKWCRDYLGRDWPHALAGYNWGVGNVARRGLQAAPAETRAYVDKIAGPVLGVSYAQAVAVATA